MDINERGTWFTATESALLLKHLPDRCASLAMRITEAQQCFVASQAVADPKEEGGSTTKAVVRRAVSNEFTAQSQSRFWEGFKLKMALEKAKKEGIGIEQAVIGPVQLSVEDLGTVRQVAGKIGEESADTLTDYDKTLSTPADSLPADQRDDHRLMQMVIRDTFQPEVIANSLAASGIVHAVNDYLGAVS